MHDSLIDQIYEAAFVPELWPDVLGNLCAVSDAADGMLLVFDDIRPIGVKTTDISRDVLEAFFFAGDRWKESERIPYSQANPITGFVIAQDYYPPGFLDRDYPFQDLRKLGFESQMGTVIPMPSGELVAFVFNRWARNGSFVAEDVRQLDLLYPHLARSGLMAARLGLERAQATVSALQAIGLPAAVMTNSGRVLTANSLLDAMPSVFLPVAFDGMAIADMTANRLFQQAIEAARTNIEPLVRSIPVAARDDREAVVIHVLPLRRAAHDIFSGADILVAATAVSASNLVPSPSILTGLFDLTPAEAKLAAALASGRSLKESALQAGITVKTARTYLERIFRKTGTSQQSQLVALLKTIQPLHPRT